jgi:hypothetical protein
VKSNTVTSGLQQTHPGYIQINSDDTFTASSSAGTETGTWSLSSDNKKLTIVRSKGDPITYDVIFMSSSSLHLQWSETEDEDLNNDGTPETVYFAIDLMLSE